MAKKSRSTERSRRTGRTGRKWRTAKSSDPHELYELAVQGTESDCAFIDRVFAKRHGRKPHRLREDFCASAQMVREWVAWRASNEAVGVDLDAAVLRVARHRFAALPARERARTRLLRGDVRTVSTDPCEVLIALNFSYFVFKRRSELVNYFTHARSNIAPGGLMIVDAYGGSGSWSEGEEERSLDGFTYVWDQAKVNPITNEVINHIHFRFPDGSEIRRAFTYEWRLWTLPEISEALVEAGFLKPKVYWEGTVKKTGEGNGVFKETRAGEACEGWIVYIVAENPMPTRRRSTIRRS
jgi:hypothetical protein